MVETKQTSDTEQETAAKTTGKLTAAQAAKRVADLIKQGKQAQLQQELRESTDDTLYKAWKDHLKGMK